MAAGEIRFVPSPTLDAQLAELSAIFLAERGPIGVEHAKQNAPVGTEAEGDPHPGELRDSIGFSVEEEDGVPVLTIIANSDHAIENEEGSEHNAPHPFLRPALSAMLREE